MTLRLAGLSRAARREAATGRIQDILDENPRASAQSIINTLRQEGVSIRRQTALDIIRPARAVATRAPTSLTLTARDFEDETYRLEAIRQVAPEAAVTVTVRVTNITAEAHLPTRTLSAQIPDFTIDVMFPGDDIDDTRIIDRIEAVITEKANEKIFGIIGTDIEDVQDYTFAYDWEIINSRIQE